MINRLELKSIEARRYTRSFEQQTSGQIRIDHNSTVTLMEAMEPGNARVEFAYTTSYGPVGLVKIEGALVWQDDQAKVDEVIRDWQETRKMPNEVASHIHTTVMQACVPEAVGLAKNLRLPPPIPLPQVKFGQKGQGKAQQKMPAGTQGPEFV